MKDFKVELKHEAINNAHIEDFYYKSKTGQDSFEVLGTVGDKLLITNNQGDLLEVYPRFCKRVI